MNMMVKNLVGIMIVVGIPVYVGAAVLSAYYDRAVNPAAFREFTVTGEGKADIKPDVATLQLSVLSEGGTNVTDVQKSNTDKMNKVISFVKSKEVKDEDITTSNYSISPRYQYFDCSAPLPLSLPAIGAPDAPKTSEARPEIQPSAKVCPPPQIVGYSVSQSASVKVRDFGKIGEILSGATAQGANSVYGPSFDLDDLASYEKAARDQAITRAKEKAEDMARAGGFTLGRLISIDENMSSPNYYGVYGKGGSEMVAMDAAPQIEAGTQRVSIQARLRYEIK